MDTEMITTKTVVDLAEKTSPVDTDLFMAGDAGSAALKKFKWSNLLAAIKTKIAAWTFETLNTSDKTIVGAVNELNNKTETALQNFSAKTSGKTALNLVFKDSVGYIPVLVTIGRTIMVMDIATNAFEDSLTSEKGILKNTLLENGEVTLIQTIVDTLSNGTKEYRVKFTLGKPELDLSVSVFVLRQGYSVFRFF